MCAGIGYVLLPNRALWWLPLRGFSIVLEGVVLCGRRKSESLVFHVILSEVDGSHSKTARRFAPIRVDLARIRMWMPICPRPRQQVAMADPRIRLAASQPAMPLGQETSGAKHR